MKDITHIGFDRLAPWYDFLRRIVFGKKIRIAELMFLDRIPDNSKILFLGGGAGEVLKHLMALKPNCIICYIDASEKMIHLAKQKTYPSPNINFIVGTEKFTPPHILFDVVITHFYLDLFTKTSLVKVIDIIKRSTRKKALWLATDFVPTNRYSHIFLLKLMYLFFNKVIKIEASQLPPWQQALKDAGFLLQDGKGFYVDFIKSQVSKKYD